MSRRNVQQRGETFGFDKPGPWALAALRLLFSVPRAYLPIVEAWDRRNPGTRKALDRLVAAGFVEHQGPVIVNVRTAESGPTTGRVLKHYRTTAKGHRLQLAARDDIRALEDMFPRTGPRHLSAVLMLLWAFDLEGSHAKFGISAGHAIEKVNSSSAGTLSPRLGRWWVARFEDSGLVRELPERLPDTREVVPEHWRPTPMLAGQLKDVIETFPATAPASLSVEFRLGRRRYLDDIDPKRIGMSGATDYDHDVTCQRALAALLGSARCAADGIFVVEPRFGIPTDMTSRPWRFDKAAATGVLFYQPDAELRERDEQGTRRAVVEYERYQSRRDAWNHIERFLGYLETQTLPFEPAILRFIVDSEARERSYVSLIECFCDWAMDHPQHMPRNQATLAVSTVGRVVAAKDPLDQASWYRIALPPRPRDVAGCPVLHAPESSPYDQYFSRVKTDQV